MRVDFYLKLMGVAKTRMLAKRLCDQKRVVLEDKAIKPSHEILPGQTLRIFLPQKEIKLKIIDIPSWKSVAKSDRAQFGAIEIICEL